MSSWLLDPYRKFCPAVSTAVYLAQQCLALQDLHPVELSSHVACSQSCELTLGYELAVRSDKLTPKLTQAVTVVAKKQYVNSI